MSVLINFKICDNSKDCGGIEICPTHAFYWDDEMSSIAIDNEKCTNCELCVKECPVDAIKVAKTDEEFLKFKKEIEEDSRIISDLFIDRYGAQPVHPGFLISQDKFNIQILECSKLAAVEFFNDDSIMCLLYSIPIKELFEGMDIKYRKILLTDDSIAVKYNLDELPALLFFKDGNYIGKICGYFEDSQKNELISQINIILEET